ncbi:MAG: DUF2490 domain-containing protein [Saprospiraceae bacterium]
MMKNKLAIFALLSVCFFQNINAQTAKQFGSWWMYFGNHKLSEKFSLHTEYQFRRSDFAKDWQQSLMRVGLDYHLPKKAMLTAGYGWIVSFPYGDQPIATKVNEHRIWQQLVLQENLGRFYFHHRYRLEQRFIENASLDENGDRVVDGNKFRQRARYRFLISIPISKKTMEDNTLFFSTYEEVFLGFGKGIQKNVLDQNRLYFALGWRFDKDFNVQLGYLNHYVIKGDGAHKEMNHTLQAAVTYNFDLQKK